MGAEAQTTAPGKTASSGSSSATRKRKLPASYAEDSPDNESYEVAPQEKKPKKAPTKAPKKKDPNAEKRLRRFRDHPPQKFHDVYQRATSQRFFVLNRSRTSMNGFPEEIVELAGSTGNIYTVRIACLPTCTCPHFQGGNQCKHILYVMSRVLRARFDLVYQLALLSTELDEIFLNAPPIEVGDDAETPEQDKNRKPIEGDCPICFMPFEEAEATVYCRAQCGQNIHKECFEMWATTKRQNGGARDDRVTCPMCRTPWQGDEDVVKKIRIPRKAGRDGYVNIADQLGISRVQDTSTYYSGPRRGGYGSWW
ncbi:hypothetical protein KJ359_002521 [Pestalotiopsis sp. 9143b]|nr:hypothetical protein KJ359_002521 [Pestalotiopsis sp. 9143b]